MSKLSRLRRRPVIIGRCYMLSRLLHERRRNVRWPRRLVGGVCDRLWKVSCGWTPD